MGAELEQKYVIASQRPWMLEARLTAQLRRAGYQVTFLEETPQRDIYYDTPGRDILAGGGSLRLREKGARRVLTVKTPLQTGDGTFLRREDELVLGGEDDPGEFLRGCLPEVALTELKPSVEVDNRRRTYEVAWPAAGRFELALDDVTYRDPATGREYRERQVEIEALDGSAGDLERVVSALRLPELHPARASKYQRAVALAVQGGPTHD